MALPQPFMVLLRDVGNAGIVKVYICIQIVLFL